jgi:hypothetical protein
MARIDLKREIHQNLIDWRAALLRPRASARRSHLEVGEDETVAVYDFAGLEPERRGKQEQFRNFRGLKKGVQGGFFLRKKPLELVLSVYSNSETAITLSGLANLGQGY